MAAEDGQVPQYEFTEVSFDEFRKKPRHSVTLLGNLGRDIQIRRTSTGKDVASVGLAVSVAPREHEDQEGGGSSAPTTQWYNLTLWEDAAQAAANTVHKGSRVLVMGNISKKPSPDMSKERLEVTVTQMHIVERQQQQQQQAALPADEY